MSTYKPSTPPIRPGAMDAFEKPSLVDGKRVPRKAPGVGCTGQLKDRKQHHND